MIVFAALALWLGAGLYLRPHSRGVDLSGCDVAVALRASPSLRRRWWRRRGGRR